VDAPAVTDFSIGDVETHEPILPWQFEEGEEAENPYYKRMTDEGGNNVYAVLKTADNQVAYLPMSNTVVYVGAEGSDCYFERTTNTYKLDGEDQTVVQFQLYVAEASAKPSTEPDLGETTANLFSLMRRNQGRPNQQFLLRACLKKADYFPKVALPSQINPGETFKPLPDTISTPIKGTDPAGVEDRAAS
jgi:hypothetical protein